MLQPVSWENIRPSLKRFFFPNTLTNVLLCNFIWILILSLKRFPKIVHLPIQETFALPVVGQKPLMPHSNWTDSGKTLIAWPSLCKDGHVWSWHMHVLAACPAIKIYMQLIQIYSSILKFIEGSSNYLPHHRIKETCPQARRGDRKVCLWLHGDCISFRFGADSCSCPPNYKSVGTLEAFSCASCPS